MVAEVVPELRGDVRRGRLGRHCATTASTSRKIETKLPGYKPTWTLRKGIEELYDAYTQPRHDQGRVDRARATTA